MTVPKRSTGRPPSQDTLPTMGLMDHLEELRKRLVRALLALVVATALAWTYIEEIFAFLARPIYAVPEFQGKKLAIFGVTDGFVLYFKVGLLAGAFLAAPFILYQLYAFVAPGLYQRERRFAVPFVLIGTMFFLAGGLFAYYIAFPFSITFLLQFSSQFDTVIAGDRYFGFLMMVVLGLGLMFELPIFLFLLSVMNVVTPGFLFRNFRWAVLIIFLLAAIVTPTPDIVNLCLFALPTIVLYLLGASAAWVVQVRRNRRKLQEAAEEPEDEELAAES